MTELDKTGLEAAWDANAERVAFNLCSEFGSDFVADNQAFAKAVVREYLAAPATTSKGVTEEQTPAREWRCFHCDEVFTEEQAARDHFGALTVIGIPITDPACCVDIGKFRDMEHQLQRYGMEDSDKDREIAAMHSKHARALMDEEEKGYARGLRDARLEASRVAPVSQKEAVARDEDDMPERIWAGDFDASGFGHCVAGPQGGLYAEYVRADLASPSPAPAGEPGIKAVMPEEPNDAMLRVLFELNSGQPRNTAEAIAAYKLLRNLVERSHPTPTPVSAPVGESQTVSLNGRTVELTGLALEVMRAMDKSEATAVRETFKRGFDGGSRSAAEDNQ
ncbi:hypothetical protein GGQ99_001342 [Aminobacter niigataensis]|uniref:C2H2-type domain-containing protein n=1 Tax=Aminobacter niigataensis TaxID=83265 RepID=A0ABR6L0N5_9HYPH|nr:hypothetical protein [Aminobacter niigataensis]MBB4649620.1 hypothetical protein [Aminobacter niigataensis]